MKKEQVNEQFQQPFEFGNQFATIVDMLKEQAKTFKAVKKRKNSGLRTQTIEIKMI